MKKPHITSIKTFEFTHPHGKQKIKLSEAEAKEFMECLAETLGYTTLEKSCLDIFKTKDIIEQIKKDPFPNSKDRWPYYPHNPLDVIGGGSSNGKISFSPAAIPCAFDGVEPGTVMGLVCNCPKCTIYCTSDSTVGMVSGILNS